MLFHYREGQSYVWETEFNWEDTAESINSWVATRVGAPCWDWTLCFFLLWNPRTSAGSPISVVCLSGTGSRFGGLALLACASFLLNSPPESAVFLQRTQLDSERCNEVNATFVGLFQSVVLFFRKHLGRCASWRLQYFLMSNCGFFCVPSDRAYNTD